MPIDWDDEEVKAALLAKTEEVVKGLKSKNDELLGKIANHKDDVDELARLKKQEEERSSSKAEKDRQEALDRGEFDRIRKQDTDAHTEQVDLKDKRINKLEEQVQTMVVTDKVINAITAEGGNPLFLNHIVKQSVKAVLNDNGVYEVHVLDPITGNRKLTADGSFMTVEGHVKELKADSRYSAAFAGTKASGSGGQNANADASTSGPNPWAKDSVNLTEQTKLFKENPEKARALKEAAGA